MSLASLHFSDLFVAKTGQASWFKPTPDSMVVSPIPQEMHVELLQLRAKLDELAGAAQQASFRVDWPNTDGMRLRAVRMRSADSNSIYVCRQFRIAPTALSSLGMPPAIARKLLDTEIKNGLVIVMGKAGAGKSTTAATIVNERLAMHGGVCWAVEAPIELKMQGRVGKGWCYQMEASSDEAIGPMVESVLRASPNIIFIGELRNSRAVREAITAGASGHLVVATFHAGDLLGGLARFALLAGEKVFSGSLAEALRAVLHLSLYNQGDAAIPTGVDQQRGTGTPPRVLTVDPLFVADDRVRSHIREGTFHMLKSEVDQQRRNLMMSALR